MQYKRTKLAGGTYFITANLADRSSTLLTDRVDELRNALRRVKQRYPFEIDAMVVMPDHFHLLMTLPERDVDFSLRIGAIKATFSRRIPKIERIDDTRQAKRERGIWQRRFWEHTIRDDADYANHVDYIHINPVKHGYVLRAVDWPHSTIHWFVKRGIVGEGWATGEIVAGSNYGENR
jgi:putative transposase